MKYIRSIFPNAIGGRPKAPCGYSRLIGFNNTSQGILHSSFVKINPYALSSSYCRNLNRKRDGCFLAIEDSLGCEFALSLILSLYSTLNQTFPKSRPYHLVVTVIYWWIFIGLAISAYYSYWHLLWLIPTLYLLITVYFTLILKERIIWP